MFNLEVAELLDPENSNLELTLVSAKKGLKKQILIPRIQKPGLALIGDTSKLHPGRLQILGKSEITFLKSLPETQIRETIQRICEVDVACFVVTRDNDPPKILLEEANKAGTAVLKTPLITSTFINRVTRFFEEHLTATTSVHGVFLDVFGVGILVIGKSGIGKSECALDLIMRGHRLVADDVVEIKKKPPATLYGSSPALLGHHLEIRGLGILDIKELFGVASIREQKMIDTVVELVEWNPNYEYDRLGIDEHKYILLDVPMPYLKIPVSPGRNVSTIIEVAARNSLLKTSGHYSSRILEERLNQELRKNQGSDTDTGE